MCVGQPTRSDPPLDLYTCHDGSRRRCDAMLARYDMSRVTQALKKARKGGGSFDYLQQSCERCGTSKRNVCYSVILHQWLCYQCYDWLRRQPQKARPIRKIMSSSEQIDF